MTEITFHGQPITALYLSAASGVIMLDDIPTWTVYSTHIDPRTGQRILASPNIHSTRAAADVDFFERAEELRDL